jgi:hypothetical protein
LLVLDTKFAIVILIASIPTMAVYGSSMNFVSALETKTHWICAPGDSVYQADCVFTSKDGKNTSYDCKYNTTTKTWSCSVAERTDSVTPNETTGSKNLNKLTDSQIPLGLKSALDSAIKNQNGGLVIGQSNTQDSNSSETTINNSPKLNNGPPPPGIRLGDGG